MIINQLETKEQLPTAILVCERHPTFQKVETFVKIGLGCWLSIVTSLSIMTVPSIAKQY